MSLRRLVRTVALIDSASWEKLFASRPWKWAQTTGLLKSFQIGYRKVVHTNFWLRYDHFKILQFCIINDYLVTFYTNIGKTKRSTLVSLVCTWSLLIKIQPGKKPQSKKNLHGNEYGIFKHISYHRVFFDCGFFLGWIFTDKLLLANLIKDTVAFGFSRGAQM